VRGESAYLLETPDGFLAHVEEGLGTKNLVADAVRAAGGPCLYRNVGIDTVATIVNDLITCGAAPVSLAMHAAVADGSWFAEAERAGALADGFAEGCRQAGAVWGGGETPALSGLVVPGTIVLAGSAVGVIRPKSTRIAGEVRDGDAIVALASSGVHTNGLTLCRRIAERLPDGYRTPIDDGRPYGEALCDPSVLYARFLAAGREAGLVPHYAVHLTGHGWRKLMRLEAPLVYRIETLPEPLPVFRFIMQSGPVDVREAYGTFNMGVGFLVYVPASEAGRWVELAQAGGYDAWVAGSVRREGERRAVELVPLGLAYEGETLRVR
jgi:phosphoribosylformylglycinamidine cyclo-ligase